MTDEISEEIVPLRITGKADLHHQLAGSMKWNLARLLVGLILPVSSCLGVTVTDHMIAKTVNTSGGCVVPTPATAFLTTDQSVWLWFNVSDAKAGDIASATGYYPSGTAYQSATWDAVPSSGARCFWWPISIAGNPPSSSPGNWSIRVSWNGSSLSTRNFTIGASGPSISAGGILNAASYAVGTPVAPGSIVAVYGSFPVSAPSMTPGAPWPTSLGGLSMQFAGTKAPLYYVSAGQVNLIVPWELANQSQASVTVTVNGQTSSAQTVSLAAYSPGIFSMNGQGTGQGAILDTSYRLVDQSNPAIAGATYLQIYCTGLGPVANQPASGGGSPTSPLASTTTTPAVSIGGVPAQVIFSVLAPGFVGEYQVNALVPASTAPGSAVPVTISIGGRTSNAVTIAVQAATGGPAATLVSVKPTSGRAGEVFTVSLTGANTGFLQGQTLASFGPGISVSGAAEGQSGVLTIASPTSATATLTIDPAAAAGARGVTLSTGGQTASLSNGFTVLAPLASMGPPTVTSTVPANKATGVSLMPTIQILFNDPLDPSTVGSSTFSIANGTANLPVTTVYDSSKYLVSVFANGALRPGATYTVTVGATLKNAVGDPLAAAYSFSFTTIPPITVSATIAPVAGLDPKTLTVLSYGGKASTPDANGNFSVSMHPSADTLVAAVMPGKTFALLAVLNNAAPAATPKAGESGGMAGADAVSAPRSRRVYATRWQITGSSAAAAASTPVLNFETTAESLLFLSPYLYTGDSTKSSVTRTAIAGNQSTAQFATALQAKMTLSNAPAHPMMDTAIQSVMLGATQDVLKGLLSVTGPFTFPTTANSTPATIFVPCTPATASATFPPTVKITPYCKNSPPPASGEFACLDLDYLSFCQAVQADPKGQGYTFTPVNCTNNPTWGCAVGWLARVAPITDGADPATIAAGGAAESPGGHTASCGTNAPCVGAWIAGSTLASKADVFGAFSDWVTAMITGPLIGDSSGSLALPSQPKNYIARFYSGGLADDRELKNLDAYTDGKSLNRLAAGINFAETAFNSANFFFSMTDAIAPGTSAVVDPANIRRCALLSMTQAAIEGAAGSFGGGSPTDLNGGVKAVGTIGASLLTKAAARGGSEVAGSVFKFAAEAVLASTGVGLVVDVVVNGAAAAGNAAEALQRSYELQHSASAVETAVIAILAGSGVPNNPVPKISSLTPASAPINGTAPKVTIKGNSFLANCTVLANNAKRSYTRVDSGTLTFDLLGSDLTQAGTFSVEVRNPAPGGGTSEAIFQVISGTASNPQPQVTSITPAAAVVGADPPTLSILGKNFLAISTVTFGGSPHQVKTPFDAGLLTVALLGSDLSKTGTFPVVVTNPAPGGGSSSYNFMVLDQKPTVPTVTAISTPQRVYVSGDQFRLDYAVLADPALQTTYDLLITVSSSKNTYYYYDQQGDTNRWLHPTPGPAFPSPSVPKSGNGFFIPADPSAFQITSDVPTGDYHVAAYFSVVGAYQKLGTAAETDFSVATDTAAGGCFIATAAFGSAMAGQVQCLRVFRDRTLLSARAGRAFVIWYYQWSPRAAGWLRGHSMARKLTRAVLWVPVAFAWTSLQTNVLLASLGFVVLFLSLGWSLRRGPAWWKVLLVLILAIGVASAQIPQCRPSPQAMSSTRVSAPVPVLRSQSREETAWPTSLPQDIRHSLLKR